MKNKAKQKRRGNYQLQKKQRVTRKKLLYFIIGSAVNNIYVVIIM